MNKIALIILGFFLITSCKKLEELSDAQKDQEMAKDNHLAESTSDDASIMSDEAYNLGSLQSRGGNGNNSILGDTVKITKVDSTITIDFGTTGIVGKDGKIRKGKIIITFANGFKKVGSSVTQTFNNYYVNGNKVEGTRTITYNGLDNNNNPYWTITSSLTITKANGKVITWTSTRTRTQTAGVGTPGWGNNEYKITGTASGTTSLGDTYSLTIGTPLYIKLSCKYIQDGTITYTRNSKTATIDYGYSAGGSCDDKAKLTYNGTDYIIDL